MRQKISVRNSVDENNNPAGGSVVGTGIDINWQDGPLLSSVVEGMRLPPNGAFVEDVLEACLARIKFYQASRFYCEENGEAQFHVERALEALDSRTKRRVDAGTEGTHEGN